MADSPINQTMKPTPPQRQQLEELKNQTMKPRLQRRQKRLCDYCNEAVALLYCRADSAKLCFSCDREVHATNQLFTKHSRSQLCDACDESPASIFCETEHSVLCQNCDWENHSLSLSSVHNRRHIEGFSGCPSLTELVTIFGFDALGNKARFSSDERDNDCGFMESELDGLSDLLVWETPSIVNLDDLLVSGNRGHNFRAMDVPPLPKNRNAICGQHKEELLRQLRELAKLEPNLCIENADVKPVNGFHLLAPEQNLQQGNMYAGFEHEVDQNSFPASEANGLQWFGDSGEAADQDFLPSSLLRSCIEERSTVSDTWLNISGSVNHANDSHERKLQQPITTTTTSIFPKVAQHELNSQERDSALSRYKEKKKTRRYDKHIRYESRKVRAESRTRINGRFAKMDH